MPLAFSRKGEESVKIPAAVMGKAEGGQGRCGEVLSTAKGMVEVACGEGTLLITEVVPQGRKRMRAADWINGRGVSVGDVLGTFAAEREGV